MLPLSLIGSVSSVFLSVSEPRPRHRTKRPTGLFSGSKKMIILEKEFLFIIIVNIYLEPGVKYLQVGGSAGGIFKNSNQHFG